MVLNNYRDQADVILLPIAKRLTGVSPNTITYISLLFAVLAGFFFALCDRSDDYLLLAFFMILLSSLFDALDGKVARLAHKSSLRGDLLDHVIDRYSDIFILGGITFSPYCPMEIGFIAIISVLMLSYMGTQAQAVGGRRHYGGWLGRADRLMLLMVVSLVQYILLTSFSQEEISEFYLLGWLMILFIILGNLNAIQRFYDTWSELSVEGRERTDAQDADRSGNVSDAEMLASPVNVTDTEMEDDIEWKGDR